MDPAGHDRTVALTSHLPQLLATALAATLAQQQNTYLGQIFGPGLLDMTRLAMSSPELWIPILRTNRAAIRSALDAYQAVLTDLQHADESDSLVELFKVGSAWAAELRQLGSGMSAHPKNSRHVVFDPDSQSGPGTKGN
jgi:prephenate dehydrogenase